MIPFAGAAATGGKLIKKGVQALGPVVAPVVKNIVKNVAPAVAPAAKKVISTVASVAAPIAKKAISTATTAVKKVVSTATTAVKNTATAAITSVKNAASNFASGVKGLVDGLFKKSAPAPASSGSMFKMDLQLFGGNKAAKGTGNAIHGNSHSTTKPAYGYTLKDRDTGEILKYGETINPDKRYTKKYLKENNSRMEIETQGTKKEMHQWQHKQILDYKSNNSGQRPRLNKSDY